MRQEVLPPSNGRCIIFSPSHAPATPAGQASGEPCVPSATPRRQLEQTCQRKSEGFNSGLDLMVSTSGTICSRRRLSHGSRVRGDLHRGSIPLAPISLALMWARIPLRYSCLLKASPPLARSA